ncbi:hypothetical protein LUCX_310 [Xanthomonas phage vB_XciM_LucasX]|nr:hypothetical protein LUCX_310 [Xanthomonas phage vB_XciM_LucasX]
MLPRIDFRLLGWDELKQFLFTESCKNNKDIDQDVRVMSYLLYTQQTTEGLYLNDTLVGFARWQMKNGHLSNLYIMPEARGHGIARKYLMERPFRSLYVIPHNDPAKRLYAACGFVKALCSVPTREFMVRRDQAAQAA